MASELRTARDIEEFLTREFPQAFNPSSGLSVETVSAEFCRVRQRYHESQIRPGGTISGPTMMALADIALYVAVLAAIGPVPLAVTINLNINFLRKPALRTDLLADARLMKLGKTLAVGEVSLYSEGHPDPVAHVTSTYSIPPAKSGA